MKKYITISLLLILIITACEKLEKNAPYREIPVVYCLLNPKDTVQYVRINRLYQAEDAYAYVRVPDSVTYKFGVWEVMLERWENGEQIGNPICFEPTLSIPKETGLFTTENNVLYQSFAPLNTKCDYVLRCRNKETGIELWSQTSILGKNNIVSQFDDRRTYYAASYRQEVLDYHGSLFHMSYDHKTIRFLYLEYYEDKVYRRYVDWYPRENPLLIAPNKEDTLDAQLPKEYFRYLSECIPVNPNVKRVAVGVDQMFTIANEELFRYINLYNATTQYFYIPDFTNIENGKGLFSCRYHFTFFGKKLKDKTIDTISHGRYLKNHRFADSDGNWH